SSRVPLPPPPSLLSSPPPSPALSCPLSLHDALPISWGGTRPLGCASEARSIQGTAVVRAHLSVFACGNDGDSDACALWTLEGCPQPPDRAFSSGSDPAYSQGHR